MADDRKEKAIEQFYSAVALQYHKSRTEGSGISHFYNECLEMPTTLKVLGSVRGKSVLDVGCGTGIYAKKLISRGATVVGVDSSEGMLAIAQEYEPKATFLKGSAYKLPVKKNTFDIVLCTLMIDHLDHLNVFFKEVNRVLKHNGTFVLSGYNPVIDARAFINRGKKKCQLLGVERSTTGELLNVYGDYFKEQWRESDFEGKKVHHYHHRFDSLLNNLLKSGFSLTEYCDAYPSVAGKKFKERYLAWSKIPLFCTIKAMKK